MQYLQVIYLVIKNKLLKHEQHLSRQEKKFTLVTCYLQSLAEDSLGPGPGEAEVLKEYERTPHKSHTLQQNAQVFSKDPKTTWLFPLMFLVGPAQERTPGPTSAIHTSQRGYPPMCSETQLFPVACVFFPFSGKSCFPLVPGQLLTVLHKNAALYKITNTCLWLSLKVASRKHSWAVLHGLCAFGIVSNNMTASDNREELTLPVIWF